MKTILITGAAGLLGSRLAEWIHDNHPDVKLLLVDDLSGGFFENVAPLLSFNTTFYKVNAADDETLDRIFRTNKIDVVYHLAAYAAECVSPFIRKFNYTNNLITTANIINLCIKYNVGRLVFTSSMAVYGRNTPPFVETMPRAPIDPYGVAKAACEMDIEIANEQHGLDYCIIRPHNVYGYNQNIWDSYRNVLGIWMYKHLNNEPITVYGSGEQTRAFSEMSDILLPLWRAGTEPQASKQIINLGGIQHISINEAAHTLSEVMGNTQIIHLPPRHEVQHAYSTYQKSVDLLGFEHKTSLYEGLSNMWAWAQKQPTRERFVWKDYEITNGLYDYWKREELLKNKTLMEAV